MKRSTAVGFVAPAITILGFVTGIFSIPEWLGNPGIEEFRLDGPTLPGEEAILHWKVSRADSVEIEPGLGTVPSSGSYPVTVAEKRIYTLVAKNWRGVTSGRLVVAPIEPPMPTVQIIAAPNPQFKGEKVTLSWTAKDADSVVVTGIGDVSPKGSHEMIASESHVYEIKASNRFGKTASDRVTVSVRGWPKPVLRLRAEPNPVIRGAKTRLSWESIYAKHVSVETLGNVSLSGAAPLQIDESLTVKAWAQGPGGTEEQSVFIEAVPPPPPTLAIYPPQRNSQVQNPGIVRQLCDDILHRLLSPHFRLVEPPSVSRSTGVSAVPPDYVTSLHVASSVSRGGFLTKESVEVTVRLSIVRRTNNLVVWSRTATAKKSKKDLTEIIQLARKLVDRRFAGHLVVSDFQSEVQQLEFQALSQALEKALESIVTFRSSKRSSE